MSNEIQIKVNHLKAAEVTRFKTIISNTMEILESEMNPFQFSLNCSRIKFAECKIRELQGQ